MTCTLAKNIRRDRHSYKSGDSIYLFGNSVQCVALGRQDVFDLLHTLLEPSRAFGLDFGRGCLRQIFDNALDTGVGHLDKIDKFSFVAI